MRRSLFPPTWSMTSLHIAKCLILAVLIARVAPARAGEFDWPQWQGPNRDNMSAETGLMKRWPAEGPHRVWLYENAGNGYSGPAIADNVLYTLGTRDDREIVLALDAQSGREKWARDIDDILSNGWGDGPRGTPTIDGDHLYAISGNGRLVCVETTTGKLIWEKTLTSLGGRRPNWGFTESPLVDGPWVVCTPGGSKGTIAALDKKTGDVVWQSGDITDAAQYASLRIADFHGVKQYVQLTMEHILGVRAADGELLWQSDWPGRTAVIPTPVVAKNSVYVTSGYSVGCKRVDITDQQQAVEIYANKNMKNHHGGVVLLGSHIYGYSDNIGWTCQDFDTGEIVWSERRALGKGSLTYADGMLYCLSEDGGDVALVEASPEGWREAGRFKLEPQSSIRSSRGRIWTHPVVANGKLYLRDQEYIYCYDVKTPQ